MRSTTDDDRKIDGTGRVGYTLRMSTEVYVNVNVNIEFI